MVYHRPGIHQIDNTGCPKAQGNDLSPSPHPWDYKYTANLCLAAVRVRVLCMLLKPSSCWAAPPTQTQNKQIKTVLIFLLLINFLQCSHRIYLIFMTFYVIIAVLLGFLGSNPGLQKPQQARLGHQSPIHQLKRQVTETEKGDWSNVSTLERGTEKEVKWPKSTFRVLTRGLESNRGQEACMTEQSWSVCTRPHHGPLIASPQVWPAV